jgi:hypothetical protein
MLLWTVARSISDYPQHPPYGHDSFGLTIPVITRPFEIAGTGLHTHQIGAQNLLITIAIHLSGYYYWLQQ